MHNQQQNQEPFQGISNSVNAVLAVAQIWCYPIIALLRRFGTQGEMFYSGRAAIGLVWVGVFIVLVGGPLEEHFAVGAWVVTAALLGIHNYKRRQLAKLGYVQHSRYDGTPWLRGDEVKIKTSHEPGLVLLAGLLALTFSVGIGAYLLIGSLAMAISASYSSAREMSTVRGLRDALVEQQILMEEVRKQLRQ